VCAFVNDSVDADVIGALEGYGIRLVALRCAGYNNVDFKAAYKRVSVVRVPGYSPNAVAEHAAALLLTLNRKTHRAFNRTREHNFTLSGLEGFDLAGKTCGVIGTGRIGQAFVSICRGFGMTVLAYDAFPNDKLGVTYVPLDELLERSDVVSLHCPLTPETRHMIGAEALARMKPTATLINTSRGALVDSRALLEALQKRRLGAAGLDVYEEEPLMAPGLAERENAVLLPHVASATVESRTAMGFVAARNILAALRGEVPETPLNRELADRPEGRRPSLLPPDRR